jgi:hypothetical protein
MHFKLSPAEVETILTRGENAKLLMENESFLSTVDDLSTFHLSALVAAPPGPAALDAREHHHIMHSALREIVTEIQSRIAAAEDLKVHIEQALEADEEDDNE